MAHQLLFEVEARALPSIWKLLILTTLSLYVLIFLDLPRHLQIFHWATTENSKLKMTIFESLRKSGVLANPAQFLDQMLILKAMYSRSIEHPPTHLISFESTYITITWADFQIFGIIFNISDRGIPSTMDPLSYRWFLPTPFHYRPKTLHQNSTKTSQEVEAGFCDAFCYIWDRYRKYCSRGIGVGVTLSYPTSTSLRPPSYLNPSTWAINENVG
jgi:hypothetical protein